MTITIIIAIGRRVVARLRCFEFSFTINVRITFFFLYLDCSEQLRSSIGGISYTWNVSHSRRPRSIIPSPPSLLLLAFSLLPPSLCIKADANHPLQRWSNNSSCPIVHVPRHRRSILPSHTSHPRFRSHLLIRILSVLSYASHPSPSHRTHSHLSESNNWHTFRNFPSV